MLNCIMLSTWKCLLYLLIERKTQGPPKKFSFARNVLSIVEEMTPANSLIRNKLRPHDVPTYILEAYLFLRPEK